MTQMVLLERSGPHATLTLNRPERHNSLVPELLSDLTMHLETLGTDKELRSVSLCANGPSFSTGGDVRAFYEQEDRVTYSRDLVGALNEVIIALMSLPCPIMANIHGPITGGSLGFLLASDLVVITPRTFIQPYYNEVGFSPDGGWTAILPDRIGAHKAKQVLLLNQRLVADDIMTLGLAEACDEDPATQMTRWREALDTKASGSNTATKHLVQTTNLKRYASALEQERQLFVDRISMPETDQGMKQFLGMKAS